MTPEEKLELLKLLLGRGVEVWTFRRHRRVIALEKIDSQIVIRYESDDIDKIHLRDFCRRRFVVVI